MLKREQSSATDDFLIVRARFLAVSSKRNLGCTEGNLKRDPSLDSWCTVIQSSKASVICNDYIPDSSRYIWDSTGSITQLVKGRPRSCTESLTTLKHKQLC